MNSNSALVSKAVPIWEHRFPGLFKRELEAFASADVTLDIDQEALSHGVLILEFDWSLPTKIIRLRAAYPDFFPRTRPAVNLVADQNEFPARHCSPIDGNLCLLGRDSRQWTPRTTLAGLLSEQLNDAINDTGDEDLQGEPAEFWWSAFATKGSYCLIDSNWKIGEEKQGTLKIQYRLVEKNPPIIQAVVLAAMDIDGNELETWNGALPIHLASDSCREITIPWVGVDGDFLPTGDYEQIQKIIENPSILQKYSPKPISGNIHARWFGVRYQSELGSKSFGDSWLFPFIHGSKKSFGQKYKNKRPTPTILRTMRGGLSDIGTRVPSFISLAGKRVAVFGLGAIGAPLAVELSRNGCSHLDIVDHDIIEPGNSVRWELGSSVWGDQKTSAIADLVTREFPWTKVTPHDHQIGSVNFDGNKMKGDNFVISEIVDQADLVIDATTSFGATTVLDDCCREKRVPLITLFASPTVKGGVVAKYGSDGGCPTCLEFAWTKGIIERPRGLGDESGLQQPPGCSEITFSGASFDLKELTLQATRLAVATLEQKEGSMDSIVYTMNFLDDNLLVALPSWSSNSLEKDTDCTCQWQTNSG